MKKMTTMLMVPTGGRRRSAPAGVWGFRADKDRDDEAPGSR